VLRLLLVGSLIGLVAAPTGSRAAVVVHNAGEVEYAEILAFQPTSLRGWTLVSIKGGQKFQLPAVELAPGRVLRVTSGATAVAAGDIQWTRRNVWNNTGDTAMLLDASGAVVAEHTYGATSARGTSPAKAASAKSTKKKR
jgi:hypothetical protein